MVRFSSYSIIAVGADDLFILFFLRKHYIYIYLIDRESSSSSSTALSQGWVVEAQRVFDFGLTKDLPCLVLFQYNPG